MVKSHESQTPHMSQRAIQKSKSGFRFGSDLDSCCERHLAWYRTFLSLLHVKLSKIQIAITTGDLREVGMGVIKYDKI